MLMCEEYIFDEHQFSVYCTNITDEIEYQYTIRMQELIFLENLIVSSSLNEEKANNYRKTLIVMLYSYFEGFCKKSLLIYADYINRLDLKVKDVKSSIAATSLETNFKRLLDNNHYNVPIRGRTIPEDKKLHNFSRRKEFLNDYYNCMSTKVQIKDETIDTESNLYSYVLKTLLFKMDMDYTIVDDFQNEINSIVNKRNAVAHGDIERGITVEEYNDFRTKTIALMDRIKALINESFARKEFLNTV